VGFDFEEMDAILNARSVAIVGASSNPMKFGGMMTASQLAMGFDGPIFLVNPNQEEILGHKAYPDLRSLPQAPELVYIGIPAHHSREALEECAEVGVKGVVMVASGFRETGEKGDALEKDALRLARQGGFRIIGPNCFGLYNPRNRLTLVPGHDFSTTLGDVAFLSQSGGLSAHIGRLGKSQAVDFSAIVSYGNGVDVNETDLLRYFARDPHTRVIAAYLEGVRDGRAFLEALKEATSKKTVVLWKVGKAESARRALMSHTGSLAGAVEIWESAFRQAGVIPASGIDEIFDVLLALKHIGRKPGRRVLVAGGGGGLCTYGADLAGEEGLEVPPLAAETDQRLKGILVAAGAAVSNPLDIGTPLIPPAQFEAAMREAANNATTDILVFDLAMNFALRMVGETGLHSFADILTRIRQECGKPLVMVLYSRACDRDDLEPERVLRALRWKLLDKGVAVFPSMCRAVRAISLVN
jgi:acetate---CoA ligase (ADP-forming) subunit alpha